MYIVTSKEMSKQLTITVPDDLNDRLQNLNVSSICQQALSQAIVIEEIKLGDLPDMDKLIERLKIEKLQYVESWKAQGLKAGMEDALELNYDTFTRLEETQEIDEDTRYYLEEQHFEYLEHPNKEMYIKGWVEGVLSVWKSVKDTL